MNMMGLCYCCSLVTLRIFFLIAVVIMNFQATLLVTLVGIVASAPIFDKLDIMNKDTIEKAHSLIKKIRQDIPTTHAAWINNTSLILGDSKTRLQLEFLRKDMNIPYAPVLQNISEISSMKTCLANITKGLQLHLNLFNAISKATKLAQTGEVEDLKAEIQELQDLTKEKQASDEQSQALEHDLAKHLTSVYMTQVAAHLTLQQLQDFSSDILHSILSIRSMAENPNTMHLAAGL